MTSQNKQQSYELLLAGLEECQQEHLLSHYHELNQTEQQSLLEQISKQDWPQLASLIERYVKDLSVAVDHYDISPAPYYPITPTAELKEKYQKAVVLGKSLISQGKVAAFTVAGGQGSRLGWNAPKGTFPASPIKKKSLFQLFAEQLKKANQSFNTSIAWYIMTSPMNDANTQSFFADHNYFGLNKEDIMFFQQGTLPSISKEGKILLADKANLALNPDGHGGSFKALKVSGALKDMRQRGCEYISYFQVDNPNVKIIDPLFLGLQALDGADMTAKMLPKAYAKEKVGNFCLINGKLDVIEYSDIADELAEATNEKGELLYNAGSIAIHMISVAFAESIIDNPDSLPYHRAIKKVAHYNNKTKTYIKPDEPNAIKLERFVFDALPLAQNAFLLETDRTEEFAPIKNAEGSDSPESSRQLQSERAARWLECAGFSVARKEDGSLDAVIELSALTASSFEDLKDKDIPEIKSGDEIIL